MPRPRALGIALLLAALLGCSDAPGRLVLRAVDAASGEVTPARLELLDREGEAHVPAVALGLTLQCVTAPPPEWAAGWVRAQSLRNPHTGTTQFYLDRPAEIELAPGRYRLRAFKGIEYEVATGEVDVRAGETREVVLSLVRWSDLPARGWYGADDHLHITRLTPEDDIRIARWMQAEDLQVANLLAMGTVDQLSVTPQHGFGDEAAYAERGTWLISGQEHPRTHFLGHTITLGARRAIDLRETYIDYATTFRAARRAGGLPGYAHFGMGPARDGLALDAPRGLVGFIEVLQFEYPGYAVWYELLDLGLRLTPTAGTDFPCGPYGVPGRERFYTRVDGPFRRAAWLEAVRAGRTFVTNGPLLAFEVEGAGPGEEVRLDGPGVVRIAGHVRFDPARDDVQRLELIQSGQALALAAERVGPGELRFELEHEVARSGWLALRASGDKRGETPLEPMPWPGWVLDLADRVAAGASLREREAFARARALRPSEAHTAAVYVRVDGAPAPATPGRDARAAAWLARLDALEARLAEDRLDEQTIWDWVPYSDGVSAEHLRRNRPALLGAIAEAREAWRDHLEGAGGP